MIVVSMRPPRETHPAAKRQSHRVKPIDLIAPADRNMSPRFHLLTRGEDTRSARLLSPTAPTVAIMKPVDNETVLKQLTWRYATKKFDPARKISEGDWKTLEQTL